MRRMHPSVRQIYEDWGPVRLPLPMRMVLTDRLTGALFVLSHTADASAVELEPLNERRHADRVVYEPFQEPRAESNGNFRLVLSGGVLSMELDPLPFEAGQGNHQVGRGQARQARILTRRGFQRRTLHIDVDPNGQLLTEEVEI